MSDPHVRLYSTSWCQFCAAEKKFLQAAGIAYDNIDVEDDEAAAREMVALSGQMGVPFTVIDHGGGHSVGILGFDQRRLARELGLHKTSSSARKTKLDPALRQGQAVKGRRT